MSYPALDMHAILDMARPQASVTPALEAALIRVEARFAEHLSVASPTTATFCKHIEQYRGKMLRPILVLLSGMASASEESQGVSEAHITVAAVIEMIHMATLVHDDVLDDADIRRGTQTVNARYGLDAAITLGDYLFARSFHLCSTLESQRTSMRIGEITAIVCEGEILQNASAGRFDLPIETYFQIIERKTAALIAAACELGALHSGADAVLAGRLHDFGLKVGTAFQIQDDLLDLIGDEHVVGKSLGRDLDKGKLTLPMIHHLAALDETERRQRVESYTNGQAASVVGRLESTGSIDHARSVATNLISDAQSLLGSLTDSPAKEALLNLASAVIERDF